MNPLAQIKLDKFIAVSKGSSHLVYLDSNPTSYTKSIQLGHATVADSIGDDLQPAMQRP